MTDQDLDQLRREKWHLNGAALRTLDDARRFIETVGFCLMYPMRKPLLAPTFIGAWTGSDKHLPMQQHAYADPRAREATEIMVRLLRSHDAYEANQFEENNAFLVAGSIFPYFYALVGERNPKQTPQPKPRSEYSPLACDAFELIRRAGTDLEAKDARRPGRKHLVCRPRPRPRRAVVEAAHHPRGLQT